MVDTINELSNLSAKLNEKSDQLNSIISTINAKLANLKLGIEVWVDTPIEAEAYRDTYDDEGRRIDRFRTVVMLGYSKVNDGWQLAVRQATLQTERDRYGEEYEETVNPKDPEPLLKASREIRSKSMRLIPELLDVMKARGESLLKSIQEAEAAAKKL